MKKLAAYVVGVGAIIGIIAVQPAFAQGAPRSEFAFGYTYLHDENLPDNLPKGWAVSAATELAGPIKLVGEVGGNAKTYTASPANVTLTIYSFMGGLKISPTQARAFAPFVQMLVGGTHGTVVVGSPSGYLTLAGNKLAFQPGAGLDLNPSRSWGVRVQGDIRALRGDDPHSEWRFLGGVVVRF